MATHASRDTTTGIQFEKLTDFYRTDGKRIRKGAFCTFIKAQGGVPLVWEFQPDDAYYFADTNEIVIYEKKKQTTGGSADEKLAACGWRLRGYQKMAETIGIPPENVNMIYILSEWFHNKKYDDILDYMKSTGCKYFFWDDDEATKQSFMYFRCKEA